MLLLLIPSGVMIILKTSSSPSSTGLAIALAAAVTASCSILLSTLSVLPLPTFGVSSSPSMPRGVIPELNPDSPPLRKLERRGEKELSVSSSPRDEAKFPAGVVPAAGAASLLSSFSETDKSPTLSTISFSINCFITSLWLLLSRLWKLATP